MLPVCRNRQLIESFSKLPLSPLIRSQNGDFVCVQFLCRMIVFQRRGLGVSVANNTISPVFLLTAGRQRKEVLRRKLSIFSEYVTFKNTKLLFVLYKENTLRRHNLLYKLFLAVYILDPAFFPLVGGEWCKC